MGRRVGGDCNAEKAQLLVFRDYRRRGEVVQIEFLPEKPGEYEFHCQWGMIRGKLIVE
jgi:hypothetical protein